MWGYELAAAWERLPEPVRDEFGLPRLSVGLYDWTVAWDRAADRAWVIVQQLEGPGLAPGLEPKQRLADIMRRLATPDSGVQKSWRVSDLLSASELFPQFPVAGRLDVTSNFSRDGYLAALEHVIEQIRAGDIFQANLSQRLLTGATTDPITLYRRLRKLESVPHGGFYAGRGWCLMSASPERFVTLRDRVVETRPIKGTRRRGSDPESDAVLGQELLTSRKDRAENVMIVDLLRNDLSRVCEAGSVEATRLCEVESFPTVHHLVSTVRGRLEAGRDAWDLFTATLPGGSITGAPKVRAMEILRQLEPTARGAYCGNLFYVGFDGSADSNILIRTITAARGWWQYAVGGGVTIRSAPADEYAETLVKAGSFFRVLTEWR